MRNFCNLISFDLNLQNFSLCIFSIYNSPISLIKVNNINLRKPIDYNTSNKRWGFS